LAPALGSRRRQPASCGADRVLGRQGGHLDLGRLHPQRLWGLVGGLRGQRAARRRFFGQGGARFSVAWSTDGGKTFGEAKIGSPSSTYDTIPVALWKDQGQVMAAAVVPSADQTGWALWRGASGTWSATNDSFQPGKAKFLAALELDAAGDGILATLAPIESSSDKLSLVLFDVVAGRLNGGPLRVANATTTMQGAFEYIGAAHGPDVAYLSWTPSDFMVPGIALRRGARAGVP
jgi:hypothetical protein